MDNGELKSHEMAAWLKYEGISQRFTAPHTSAHNGQVECMHRTLMAEARTMRIHANCPEYLWDKFYLMAVYLHICTLTCATPASTPWEAWNGWQPEYLHM